MKRCDTKRFGLNTIGCGIVLLGLGLPGAVLAEQKCFPAQGKFESQTQPPQECTAPIYFCTLGALTGTLHGEYRFTAQQIIPANETSVPAAYFFSGYSVVKADKGELYLTDTGALDMLAGRIGTLLTVTGGTDQYEGATGYLIVHGSSDAVTQTNTGRYLGEVCVVGE